MSFLSIWYSLKFRFQPSESSCVQKKGMYTAGFEPISAAKSKLSLGSKIQIKFGLASSHCTAGPVLGWELTNLAIWDFIERLAIRPAIRDSNNPAGQT